MEDTIKIELLTPLTGTFLPNEMEKIGKKRITMTLKKSRYFLKEMI